MTDGELFLPDAAATQAFGEHLGRSLPAGTVLLLHGDLGSGKTTMVQGIGTGLGITDVILSPTFTLVSEYFEGRIPLYHLDLYRLDPAEVEQLNLETYWEGVEMPLGLVTIEWAERLLETPHDCLELRLAIAQTGRKLLFSGTGTATKLLDQLTSFQTSASQEQP